MDIQEIIEYNKRCAKFLGWKYVKDGDFWNPDAHHEYSFTTSSDLKFHSDWNLIHDVIEAIEKLKGFSVYIGKNRMNKLHNVEISYEDNTWRKRPHIDKTIFIQNNSKKQAVTQAINQFLIWYNNESSNKNNQGK